MSSGGLCHHALSIPGLMREMRMEFDEVGQLVMGMRNSKYCLKEVTVTTRY